MLRHRDQAFGEGQRLPVIPEGYNAGLQSSSRRDRFVAAALAGFLSGGQFSQNGYAADAISLADEVMRIIGCRAMRGLFWIAVWVCVLVASNVGARLHLRGCESDSHQHLWLGFVVLVDVVSLVIFGLVTMNDIKRAIEDRWDD